MTDLTAVHYPELERKLEPRGRLLNDNITGVDHLGYSIYAEALSELLHRVHTPLTVGVFAPWGSGKSFLLREVRYLLSKFQQQDYIDEYSKNEAVNNRKGPINKLCKKIKKRRRKCSCVGWTVVMLLMLFLLVGTLVVALYPNAQQVVYEIIAPTNNTNALQPQTRGLSTEAPTASTEVAAAGAVGFFAVVVLLSTIAVVFLVFLCCASTTDSKWWKKTRKHIRLVSYSAFTQIPTLSERSKTMAQEQYDIVIDFNEDAELSLLNTSGPVGLDNVTRCKTKYIFVNFKAWEYAGSDTLWAGIVTNLTKAIELEFGWMTSRLFRMLNVEEVCDVSKRTLSSTVRVSVSDPNANVTQIKRLMTQYGVVLSCGKEGEAWNVRFSNATEANNATKSLRILGFQARMANNKNEIVEKVTEHDNNCIEMNNLVDADDITTSRLPEPTKITFASHFLKHPKRVCCGCPFLCFCVLFFIAIIVFPIGVCILVTQLQLDVMRTSRAIPAEVQILAWMPAAMACLVVFGRFCYAMFQSQTRRVNQALVGAKGNMATELGFMNKVKDEVKIIEKLVRCLRFTHKKNYKIIISIDDLDRCPHEKVKSVLEAVSILLSDRSSPFICLIALDSRVAVKCIEEDMGSALLKANVNGHEYLKKIINLPFCLPELGSRDKRRYFAGMMDQADRTKLKQKTPELMRNGAHRSTSQSGGDVIKHLGDDEDALQDISTQTGDGFILSKDTNDRDVPNTLLTTNHHPPSPPSLQYHDVVDGTEKQVLDDVGEKEFLFLCRKFLHDDETLKYHLSGNPRNMKRIFNVVSMTTQLMRSLDAHKQRSAEMNELRQPTNTPPSLAASYNVMCRPTIGRNAADAKDIVGWVVLTDQWPYRVSYLLQVIEDADQRSNAGRRSESIDDDVTLICIYQNTVIPELNSNLNVNEATLLSLDGDPDLFLGFLQNYSITKRRAIELKSVTVNLDHSLRQNIALYRSLVDLQKNQQQKSKEFDYCK
nr:uncharacterized protein LOC100178218 [Ciona intestinalis]|eukprot:XP_002120296.1 uncharacterized protein LOC100178218 [Ciona intestinalis]